MTARLHNTDLLDRATSDALRSLDPAADVDQQVVAGPRAQGSLARILATGSDGPATPPPVRTGWARPRRRWALAGAALVGVGALVLAPGMVRDQTAFASWSATPTAVAPGPATVSAEDCRTTHARIATRRSQEGQSSPGSDRTGADTADVLLVERRGVWTFVVLGGAGGFEATCLLRDTPGGRASSTGFSGTLEAGTVASASNTVVTHGANAIVYDDSILREIIGRVGSNVASVVINTREQGPVNASVHGGYFAAWWPGPPIVGVVGTDPQPTITLILKDGTTTADIPMVHLDPARN